MNHEYSCIREGLGGGFHTLSTLQVPLSNEDECLRRYYPTF